MPDREIINISDLKDPVRIAAAAYSAQAALEGILRVRDVIDSLSDEEKVSLFWTLEGVNTVAYAAQCYIAYSLSRRDTTNRMTLKQVAQLLGVSYQKARLMAGTWHRVFRPFVEAEEEIPELPPRFYEEIYRKVNKYGVDPREAVKYAWERKVEDPKYGYRQLSRDIESNLPSPEDKELIPSCTRCRFLIAAPSGAKLILEVSGEEVAEGDGSGLYFCDAYGLLRRDISDPVEKAKDCVRYEPKHVPRSRGR